MSDWQDTSDGPNVDWEHICGVFQIQRIDPCSAAVVRQAMELAAAKLKVPLEGEGAKAGRRLALLEIFNCYGGKDRGA